MPPRTKVRTFIAALKTGETPATRKLTAIFGRPKTLAKGPLFEAFNRRPGALNGPIHDRTLLAELNAAGFPTSLVRKCVDPWPNDKKEEVRRKLVEAVDAGRSVEFSWELTAGGKPDVAIDDHGKGVIKIRAQSPRSSLRYSAAKQDIAVGPPYLEG